MLDNHRAHFFWGTDFQNTAWLSVDPAESMLLGAFEDINCCYHFADDWDEPDNVNLEDV